MERVISFLKNPAVAQKLFFRDAAAAAEVLRRAFLLAQRTDAAFIVPKVILGGMPGRSGEFDRVAE